jgi:hypothetical protein
MSFGMGAEETVPLKHKSRDSNNGSGRSSSGKKGGSGGNRGGGRGKATSRFATELYGNDTYSSSYRTKTQKKRDANRRHANFLENEMRKQNQLIKQQDSSLEMLSTNLTRLGDISHVVSRELDEQAEMLDDLDKEVNKGKIDFFFFLLLL